MRRFVVPAAIAPFAAGTLAAAALAASGGSSSPAPDPASHGKLRDPVCQKALDPGQRTVSVTAVMKPLAGTKALQMKFELLTKSPTDPAFAEVHGGDLETWISPPKPTLGQRAGDVWQLNKPVADLPAPAVYRFRVTFRWIGAHRRVLATTSRYAPRCAQPELRPDLQVTSFTVEATKRPAQDRYVVGIYNAGATAAHTFNVEFIDGSWSDEPSVTGLKSHATTTVSVLGPVCDSTPPPTVALDPDGSSGDFNVTNNTATAIACP